MVKQKWTVTLDGETHTVEYECSVLTGKTTLFVDGDSFVVRGKPFGIGLERREPIMVGESRAMLDVKRNGKANLIFAGREGKVEEV